MTQSVSVIVPAYNEEKRLPATLDRIYFYLVNQGWNFELIVVDDGSCDQTASLVRSFTDDTRVVLITHPRNQGKGAAVKTGIQSAHGQYICFSDADLATPIEELPKLLTALESHDVAIGSRKNARHGESWIRQLGAQAVNGFVRLMVLPEVSDSQCGFKAFRKEAVQKIASFMTLTRFDFDIEMLLLTKLLGFSFLEIPVAWQHQAGSTVHPLQDGLRLLFNVSKLRLRHSRFSILGGSHARKSWQNLARQTSA